MLYFSFENSDYTRKKILKCHFNIKVTFTITNGTNNIGTFSYCEGIIGTLVTYIGPI